MKNSTTQPNNEKYDSFHLLLLAPDFRRVVVHQDLLADKNPAHALLRGTSLLLRPGPPMVASDLDLEITSVALFLSGLAIAVKKNSILLSKKL
jgi:hypothetical protein